MADIRTTAELDNFIRADENPVQPPWYRGPGNYDMAITSNVLGGTTFPPNSSVAYYSAQTLYGADGIEVWGQASGDPGLTGGWRMGLYTVASIASGVVSGYQTIPWNAISGDEWQFRVYTNGNYTQPGRWDRVIPKEEQFVLMKRNGADVEVWCSLTSDPTGAWDLVGSITDTTYSTEPFYGVLGAVGIETGWLGFGAGVKNRQHIYRWLRGSR